MLHHISWKMSLTNTRGRAETGALRKNIEEQLNRLLSQLQDLEEMKAELDAKEYDEMKSDTRAQVCSPSSYFELTCFSCVSSKPH